MLRVGLLLLLLAVGPAWGWDDPATVPQPRQFSVFDGLPSNRINAIAEDAQGYLWIGTRDGLARYDGVGFRIWRVGDGLRDNFVWSLHVDAQDRLWIGTRNAGLAVLEADRASFRHFDLESHPEMGSNTVWMVASTPDGMVWVGTGDAGLVRIDAEGRLRRFVPEPGNVRSVPALGITGLRVDGEGRLWVATRDNGMAWWTGRDFERVAAPLAGRSVDLLTFDRAGKAWISMPGEGFVMAPGGEFAPMPWRDPLAGAPALGMLLEDAQGAHWLDTRSGMAREAGGRVQDVPLYSHASRGRVRPAWSSALEDREGGLWFASLDYGLWHVPANWRNFTVLARRDGDPGSLANAYVHGVASARDGGLWLVGSGGVLDWLDPRNGEVRHRQRAVCGDLIATGVHEGRDGVVWVGCRGHLARYDPRSGEMKRWSRNAAVDPAPANATFQFLERSDGTLWLSDDAGVQWRDRDGRVLANLRAGDEGGLPQATVITQMSRGPEGGIWLATSQGLWRWDEASRHFSPVPGSPEGYLRGFSIANDGTVWTASMGKLSAWRWVGATLAHVETIGAAEGMPMLVPSGVAVDGSGTLWLPTVRGLIRYEPEERRLRVYGVRDGLPSQEFSDTPIHVLPMGMLAMGTADGLLLFHPQQVQAVDRLPPLAIESVDVRRGDARIDLPRQGTVTLQHGDRDLRVVLRLLSFTDAHAHHYRFRLGGHDEGWVEAAGGERVFSQLGAGDYRLDVQARTADSDWTPVQSLQLHMQRPWWATRPALAVFAACLALLAWLVALSYRNRLRRRNEWQLAEHKREVAEQASLAKTRFLATLGHEVRTPMTGVLGMSELLQATPLDTRQRGYVDAIRRAGEHLMRLVNDALDLARIEADKLQLDPQPFDLHALVDEVVALCEPAAQRRGLAFRSDIDDDVPRWLLGDAMRVRQILLNLLGNANKFTEEGSVELHVGALSPVGIRLTVSDTGPGLNDEQKQRLFRRFEQAEGARTTTRYGGSGLGLAICQELAAAMDGRIEVDSAPGEGTSFVVDLRLPKAEPVADAASTPATDVAADGLQLLLVEDDATVAEVVAGLLEARGHRVVRAANGLNALAEAATGAFELALLDLDLPGIDGLTLARMLREQGFARPIIAVTARADAEAEPLAREAGFDGFLRKPLTGAMLAEAIEAALAEPASIQRRTDEAR
ncbi:hybrid sensor histidine kinase/response regulator [Luteimonas aestuarii]|uniref:histidine kinase n=1 Tax=Luteimonas aestuarii TaxID=453837 RepID=A0A4R5U1C6_9GAMM|nr:two-component regulator propeller domain-containing protein [Luteimonas aestuarii]TDK27379.1 hybrid sensor histidine kinase/response regulator [Luteimonas aestuarii]